MLISGWRPAHGVMRLQGLRRAMGDEARAWRCLKPRQARKAVSFYLALAARAGGQRRPSLSSRMRSRRYANLRSKSASVASP